MSTVKKNEMVQYLTEHPELRDEMLRILTAVLANRPQDPVSLARKLLSDVNRTAAGLASPAAPAAKPKPRSVATQPKKKFTEKELSEMKTAFDRVDADKSGVISVQEMGNIGKELGISLSPEELQTAFRQLDKSGDGTLDFQEFCDWWGSDGKRIGVGSVQLALLKAKLRAESLRDTFVHAKESLKDVSMDAGNVHISLDLVVGDEAPESSPVNIKFSLLPPSDEQLNKLRPLVGLPLILPPPPIVAPPVLSPRTANFLNPTKSSKAALASSSKQPVAAPVAPAPPPPPPPQSPFFFIEFEARPGTSDSELSSLSASLESILTQVCPIILGEENIDRISIQISASSSSSSSSSQKSMRAIVFLKTEAGELMLAGLPEGSITPNLNLELYFSPSNGHPLTVSDPLSLSSASASSASREAQQSAEQAEEQQPLESMPVLSGITEGLRLKFEGSCKEALVDAIASKYREFGLLFRIVKSFKTQLKLASFSELVEIFADFFVTKSSSLTQLEAMEKAHSFRKQLSSNLSAVRDMFGSILASLPKPVSSILTGLSKLSGPTSAAFVCPIGIAQLTISGLYLSNLLPQTISPSSASSSSAAAEASPDDLDALVRAVYYEEPDAISNMIIVGGLPANAIVSSQSRFNTIGVDSPLLHIAVNEGNISSAGALLAYGADVNAKNAAGFSPLQVAALSGQGDPDLYQLLLSFGAQRYVEVDGKPIKSYMTELGAPEELLAVLDAF